MTKKRITIQRNSDRSYTTNVHLFGRLAHLSLRVESRLGPRQRRAIALAFFRQVRPFIRYFEGGYVFQGDDGSGDFRRMEKRGVRLFNSVGVDQVAGRRGFAIRMKRLEKGWTQRELAERAGMSDRHLSRMERGCCEAHRSTLRRLESVLGVPLVRDDVSDSKPPL